LEIETLTMIGDSTKLTLNISTLDSEFTGNKSAGDGFLLELIPYSPETNIFIALEQDYGNYRVRLDHSRVGEHPSFPYNSQDFRSELTHIDSSNKTNFYILTEPLENMQLNFWIKNLTNKSHQSSAISFPPSFGYLTVGYFDAPRTIGLDLHYKF